MRYLAALPVALLAACDPALDPGIAISSYNGDTVTVSSPGSTAMMRPQSWHDAKAREACESARYASTRQTGPYTVEFLYLC
jgi:hypothetical protein